LFVEFKYGIIIIKQMCGDFAKLAVEPYTQKGLFASDELDEGCAVHDVVIFCE
jgi:hypothetical protein